MIAYFYSLVLAIFDDKMAWGIFVHSTSQAILGLLQWEGDAGKFELNLFLHILVDMRFLPIFQE